MTGHDNIEDDDVISKIYLVRHGDRFDYANPSWVKRAKASGNIPTDPPLSELGHRQARETAAALKDSNATSILASPYLRVIQTACPTSDALGIPINVEDGLSEAHATPGLLPTPSQRFAYFPQLDPEYHSMMDIQATPGYTCRRSGSPCEAFAGMYVKRMETFAAKLERQHRGRNVVCFSHAASVALVAALLRCDMAGLKFAPCGIFELRRVGDGPWGLVSSGATNEAHVSENAPTTFPWGFEDKHFEEDGSGKYQGFSQGIGLDFFSQKT